MKLPAPGYTSSLDLRGPLAACALAMVLCLALGTAAFTRPLDNSVTRTIPYTQRATFTYRAEAPAGPVYPTGRVDTGDAIFLALVHGLGVGIDYDLVASAPHSVQGTEQAFLKLSAPTGWSRTMPVGAPRRFRGDHFRSLTPLDLPAVESLLAQVQELTGVDTYGSTLAVEVVIRTHGIVAGNLTSDLFTPSLDFQLQPQQLQPAAGSGGGSGGGSGAAPGSGASSGAGGSAGGFTTSQAGGVTVASTAPNPFRVAGHDVSAAALRWVVFVGLLLAALGTAVLAALHRRGGAGGEPSRIQSQYGHQLISIAADADLGWPAADVTSMKALARLAERSGQLILHSRDDDGDTYLVNDGGTVYRYQVKQTKIVWGDWSATATQPVAANGSAPGAAAVAAAGMAVPVTPPPAAAGIAVPVTPAPVYAWPPPAPAAPSVAVARASGQGS